MVINYLSKVIIPTNVIIIIIKNCDVIITFGLIYTGHLICVSSTIFERN